MISLKLSYLLLLVVLEVFQKAESRTSIKPESIKVQKPEDNDIKGKEVSRQGRFFGLFGSPPPMYHRPPFALGPPPLNQPPPYMTNYESGYNSNILSEIGSFLLGFVAQWFISSAVEQPFMPRPPGPPGMMPFENYGGGGMGMGPQNPFGARPRPPPYNEFDY